MTLYERIRAVYPQLTSADFTSVIRLQDDGAGPRIAAWNSSLPRPSDEQLANAVARVEVPQIVSAFQARAALDAAGLLDSVEAMMANPATQKKSRLAWAHAQEFRRNSPTVKAMAQALGLGDAALDALFTAAAGIEA